MDAINLNDQVVQDLNDFDCLIIDNFDNNINEKLFYSILNQSKQLENYILINSEISVKNIKFNFKRSYVKIK